MKTSTRTPALTGEQRDKLKQAERHLRDTQTQITEVLASLPTNLSTAWKLQQALEQASRAHKLTIEAIITR